VPLTSRPATPADIEFVRQTHRMAFEEVVVLQFGRWNADLQERFFQNMWREGPLDILLDSGIPCGFAGVEQRPDMIWLGELAIRPEFQGKGLGTQFIQRLLNDAAKRCLPVHLQVLKCNRARVLYERMGFKHIATREFHFLMAWDGPHQWSSAMTTDLTMQDALAQAGVNEQSLTAAETADLDRDGYVVIPHVLDPSQVAAMAACLEALGRQEGDKAGTDFQVEAGTTRLGSLLNKSDLFDVCFTHPKVLAAGRRIMGLDFGLSSFTSRSAKPGEGHQAFHRDTSLRAGFNALWLISDFTPHNGPTRFIPGTHHRHADPGATINDLNAHHPDEKYLIAPAGSLALINGHLWHSGTRNASDKPRHLISAFWLPRGQYQPEAQRKLTPEAYSRLSDATRLIIDHEAPAEAGSRKQE
jgi:ectoine hydroxylase-related dioxygenase (phytanoyl-CoA dioxygenase family)/GNAT superfamily N-acetyltransferase